MTDTERIQIDIALEHLEIIKANYIINFTNLGVNFKILEENVKYFEQVNKTSARQEELLKEILEAIKK